MTELEQQPLSDREREILALLATGATNQEIARALHISPNTVKVHLRNIYAKLHVMNRSEAILVGFREGIITLPGISSPERLKELPSPPSPPTQMPYLGIPLLLGLLAAIATVVLIVFWPQKTVVSASVGSGDVVFSDIGRSTGGLPARQPAPRWFPQAPLDTPLSRMAIATWQGRVFVFGGETTSGIVSTTRVYDPQRGVWAYGRAKPTAVSNAQAARIGDRIYVFGGIDASYAPTDIVEIYNPTDDSWSQGPSLPHPLAGAALAVWQQRIYLFGGWDGSHYLTSVYAFAPDENRWQVLPPLQAPRAFATAASLDDAIYVIGGYDGQTDVPDVWVFNPAAVESGHNPWSTIQPLLSPRGGAGAAVIARSLYVIGGGIALAVSGAERYDPTTDTWARVETPYGPNWRHMGVAPMGGSIITVGGWSGTHLPFVEAYQASFRSFIPYGPINQGD